MYKLNGLIVVSLFGLTACGGSSSSGSSTVINNGVFKDSNVFGLTYESGSQKGVTDEDGAFKYEEGTDVNFSVGGVDLGSGEGKAVMTPIDLVDGGTLGNAEVINKVRFLMMLDKDNTPSNGIEISTEVQAIAEDWEAVDFSEDVFPSQALNSIIVDASVEDAVSHALPDSVAATAHLQNTLLCSNAGAFKGSYSGSEIGTVVFVVDPVTGEVNGSSYNPDNEVSVEVSNTEAIDYDAGLTFVSAEASAKSFSGTLQSTDEIEGAWSNVSDEASTGLFEATRFGSESDSTFRYAASFIGDDKGVFTFNTDAANNITGTVYSVSSGEESSLTGKISTDNQLTAISVAGDEITGFIDPDTLAFTSGVWINGDQQSSGSFAGGGCRLN